MSDEKDKDKIHDTDEPAEHPGKPVSPIVPLDPSGDEPGGGQTQGSGDPSDPPSVGGGH